MTTVNRYDAGELIGSAKRTDEGFILADAVVSRTGVFVYQDGKGGVRRELRHPDDVFKADSLETLKLVPITNGHPKPIGTFVTRANADSLAVGQTGDNIRPDGRFLMAPLKVIKADGIDAIDKGRRGLSCGYKCDLMEEAGTYNGEPFTHRQTNIRYNHLALVDKGRAGDMARINLDADDAAQVDPSETREDQMSTILSKITVDGIAYDAAPEVANKLAKETARADAAENALKAANTALSTTTAERDTLKDKVTKFDSDEEKKKRQDAIDAAAKARVGLVSKAALVLKPDDMKKLDGMSDAEIKALCIKTVSPSTNLDGKDETYVNVRFDMEMDAVEAKGGKRAASDGLGSQRKAAANGARADKADEAPDYNKARADGFERMRNNWGADDKEKRA